MNRMNEYQRGVLAAGAIILLSVTLNAPTVQIHQGTIYRGGTLADTVATMVDWRTTLTYSFATLSVTALLWLALRGIDATRAAAASQVFTAAVIQARDFELIDKKGKCRGRLKVEENGRLAVSLADEIGTMRTWLTVDANGTLVQTFRK